MDNLACGNAVGKQSKYSISPEWAAYSDFRHEWFLTRSKKILKYYKKKKSSFTWLLFTAGLKPTATGNVERIKTVISLNPHFPQKAQSQFFARQIAPFLEAMLQKEQHKKVQ